MIKMKRFAFLFFPFLVLSTVLSAQKAEEGSSPDNPWSKEMNHGFSMALNYRDPPTNYRYSLSFGNWKFESKFKSRPVINEISNADPGIFKTYLSHIPYNHRNAILFSVDSIHVNGTAPGGLSYGFYFSYTDSLFEQYDQVLLSFQHFEILHFYRALGGMVQGSSGESSPFYIKVIFTDTVTQTLSYVLAGKDTISLKAVADPEDGNVYKSRASRNAYAGFDFYKNDTLVGAAHRTYNFAGVPKYRYWFSPQLNLPAHEVITAMIFLIVGFIE